MEATTGVVSAILAVWTAIANWYIDTFELVPKIFYNSETGLTFVGVLAVVGAGLAIIIGLVMTIRSFLKSH